MLISYRFKNFCSFADEAEFDLLVSEDKSKRRFPDNYVETEQGYDVIKTAVIVGENAGGKTNFINSLHFFKSLFEDNKSKHAHRSLININNLPSSCPGQCDTGQLFDIVILSDRGIVYHYYLEIDEFSIVQEELSYKEKESDKENIIMLVKREQIGMTGDRHAMSVPFDIVMENHKIEEIFAEKVFTKDDIGLFVTKMAILGDGHAREFVDWVNNKLIINSRPFNAAYDTIQSEEDFKIIHDERFLNVLKMVDYSIQRIEIDDQKPFSDSRIIRKSKDGRDFSRELKHDSAGVMDFFACAVQLFKVVYEDKIIFADEMDRVINPVLAEKMVAFINGKKHKGQFIFSTHNALHLDLKNYMKEQIYFITKGREDLNSELYSLVDFPEVKYEMTKIYEFYMKGILGGTAFE